MNPSLPWRLAKELAGTRSELERTNTHLAHALGRIRELERVIAAYEARERDLWTATNRRLAALQDAVGRSAGWRAA